MKHKHADLIHAWADGAEIEYFDERNEWVDVSAMPLWDKKDKYRIKPETIELTQQTDLTDEEIATLWHEGGMRDNINGYDFARAIIAKFKEKNASPSVEAAIEAALLKQQELWIQATEDGIEAVIEATKEKAAKFISDSRNNDEYGEYLAAAIRSMK